MWRVDGASFTCTDDSDYLSRKNVVFSKDPIDNLIKPPKYKYKGTDHTKLGKWSNPGAADRHKLVEAKINIRKEE